MENLTYLYVLAEEAEHPAKSGVNPALNRMQRQERSRQPMPLQSQASETQASQTQAAQGQHWLDSDCDRSNQAYPTFYL